MTPQTTQWVQKAEEDWLVANRESQAADPTTLGIIGFHCQQLAEKYLKARLAEASVSFKRSHDLVYLLDLLKPVPRVVDLRRIQLYVLNSYAVDVRYPGGPVVTASDAASAIAVAGIVRRAIRIQFGLQV